MAKTDAERRLRADIRVIGVGGGGGNAVETMWKKGVPGVRFIAVNTDAQALAASSVETKIQLGANLTKGLGAGANPEVGRRAAIESYEDIAKNLKGADMVFITAGMGGGTGTGGIAVAAEAARELGALTVGVVTYPFLFEGRKRRRNAQKGIQDLKSYVDTLIVIHNDKLLTLSDDKTPLAETFQKTDNILFQAVQGIAGLISVKGLINLDFADVKTVMQNKGMALMGIGAAEGRNRAADAVSQAVSSPLLENISIKGATGIIANVTGGADLSLMEVNQAISLLTDEADEDAEIIVGAAIDEEQKESLTLTVIATGFEEKAERASDPLLKPAGGTPFSSGLSGKVFLRDSFSSFHSGGPSFKERQGGGEALADASSDGASSDRAGFLKSAALSEDEKSAVSSGGLDDEGAFSSPPSSLSSAKSDGAESSGGKELRQDRSLSLKEAAEEDSNDSSVKTRSSSLSGSASPVEEGASSADKKSAAKLPDKDANAADANAADSAAAAETDKEEAPPSSSQKEASDSTAIATGTAGAGAVATGAVTTGGAPSSDKSAESLLSKKKEDMTPRELLLSKIQEYKDKQALLKQEGKQMPLEEAEGSDEGKESFSDNEGLLFETDVQVTSD